MLVRTRFAPSPTGFLHIGSARTALYAWLYARHHRGQFILRIEDTDVERSTPESVQTILDGMRWLGLDYDEGPFFQTKRFARYKEMIHHLLIEDKAYRCYCSKERLDTLRAEQLAQKHKPRYDGHCRDLKTHLSKSYVVRFRNPEAEEIVFIDQVHGKMSFKSNELDDLIIARSDGTPTYNFAVVVDDMDMKITHVIRGDDHLNNTPRQITMLQALDAPIPTYAHVPMILGTDGQKLSKRHGAVSVMQYRDEGYLPEALLNYLVRLGWSHGDQEIFSRQEMIRYFDATSMNKAPAAFNYEKLNWLNQHYIKTSDPTALAKSLEWHMRELGINIQNGPPLKEVVTAQRDRAKTLHEMAEKSCLFYREAERYSEGLDAKAASSLGKLQHALRDLIDWNDESIHQVIYNMAEKEGLKLGQLAQPLRIAITGGTVSPPINTTLRLLGKERVLKRLERALASIG